MLHVNNSIIFGGSDPALTAFRCFIPEWLIAELEHERELEEMQQLPESDPVFSTSVFGEEATFESMSSGFHHQLSRSRDRSMNVLTPPAEICESPQQFHRKGQTRSLMLA